MAQNKENLAKKISELAAEHWEKHNKPLLLSQLGPGLKALKFDYKEIIEGQRLQHFIRDQITGVNIVKHPIKFAKIGILPNNATYLFPDAPPAERLERPEADRLRKNRRAFYGFIEAISDLPPEEIEGVSIPARVIVRLLEGK